MSLSNSEESLLLATIISTEDLEDKARRSSFCWDLSKLHEQGSPIIVEFIRLARPLRYSVLRLRAYNASTGQRLVDRLVFNNKAVASREWGNVTGSPLPEDIFSDSGLQWP